MSGDETTEWVTKSDGSSWEERVEVMAEVECQKCGTVVELEANTEEWTQGEDGRWHHESYGPATGTCCGLLFADWWEGTFVYDLEGEPVESTEDES